ncbi:MAG: PAS domain S-box protein [Anaerolineae bacterium]|nr:PAS domain S-box protein [Anaerolineae bacterium]
MDHKTEDAAYCELAMLRKQVQLLETRIRELEARPSITEIETALRISESRYLATIDQQTDLICRFKPDGTLTFANRAYCRYVGKQREQILDAYTIYDFIPLEDQPKVREHLTSFHYNKPVATIEHRVIARGGKIRWVQWINRPIFSPAEKIIGFQSVGQDITERRQVEEALKKNEANLAAIIENTPDAIWSVDEEFRIVKFNSPAKQRCKIIFGKEMQSGMSVADIVPPASQRQWIERYKRAIQGDSFTLEEQYTLNNQTIAFELSFYPILDEWPPRGIAVFAHEITHRKEAQALLRRRDAILEAIAFAAEHFLKFGSWKTQLPDVLQRLGIAADASRAFAMQYQDRNNSTFAVILDGWETVDIIPILGKLKGQGYDIQSADLRVWQTQLSKGRPLQTHRDELPERIQQILAARNTFSILALPVFVGNVLWGYLEFDQCIYKRVWSELEIEALQTAANILGAAILSQKALADLRAERALLEATVAERTTDLSMANAELARANRLKDEFLANMSHELRTPLNAILAKTEIIQEGIYGTVNEKQYAALNTIEESGRHLLALINDVLDLAKIGAGKVELAMAQVSVPALSESSLRMVKLLAQQKHIQIHTHIDNRVMTLQGDGRRLKQILVNLLNNAVKFTPEDGEVGLTIKGNSQHEIVEFTIWDTGIGINPHDLKKLFKPFMQIDGGLTRQHEGTGLGLALVHQLVEMHGGSITVESTIGKGSRFTVSLPWIMAHHNGQQQEFSSQTAPDSIPELVTGTMPLVLIADDNIWTLETLEDYLEAKGFQTILTHNGKEAVQQAQKLQPDLILMDIQMPEMDGIEAMRSIRACPDLSDTPIIALTALAMPGDKEECLEAGANDYLSKPLSLKALIGVLETYLG